MPLLFYVVHLLGGWQSIIDLVSEGDEQEQGRMMVALFKENFTPISFLIMGLLIIPVFVVSYLYTASFFFIWFYQLSFWGGMEASRMLVTRHFGMLLLFNLVWGLILSISAIPCGLGLLFTVPAYACSQYVAFAHLTGLNEVNPEIDDITEHFIAPQ